MADNPVSGQKLLDGRGRCCGRKPTTYKRPVPQSFCPRCDRAFDEDGIQTANWAWRIIDGVWESTVAKRTRGSGTDDER